MTVKNRDIALDALGQLIRFEPNPNPSTDEAQKAFYELAIRIEKHVASLEKKMDSLAEETGEYLRALDESLVLANKIGESK